MSGDLIERLREHATDWDGRQMPDLEPAKGDPTAGTLREAADLIATLQAREAELVSENAASGRVIYRLQLTLGDVTSALRARASITPNKDTPHDTQ